MSEAKRYFINPIPDEGGALDELPNVICLDETPGITYYTYVRERTCHVVSTIRYDYEGGYAGTEYVTELSCGHKFTDGCGDAPNYCPECGARVIGG